MNPNFGIAEAPGPGTTTGHPSLPGDCNKGGLQGRLDQAGYCSQFVPPADVVSQRLTAGALRSDRPR
jgi:hypothetical protein